jgi:hypothetical protein
MTAPAPSISNELKTVLRAVKLGRCLDTLPERLALAGSRHLSHAQFLELVLSDEITRRETTSAALRARSAGLDPDMSLANWDETTKVSFDHAVWDELCSLRFVEAGHNALILGPPVIAGSDLEGPRSCRSGRCCDRCDVCRVAGAGSPSGELTS